MANYSDAACSVCGKKFPLRKLVRAGMVRPSIAELIEQSFPGWSREGYICTEDLNRFRSKYVYSLIEAERGELTSLEKEVVESIARQEILATEVEQEYATRLTLGQRLSDSLASFGGSWAFIFFFTFILIAWVTVNSISLLSHPQEEKDRLRAMHDYQINLKAELEIRHLHEKMDHQLSLQWERLVNIQEVLLEVLS